MSIPMRNSRRRAELLIFIVMASNASEVCNIPKYAQLGASGPFALLPLFDQRLAQAVPDNRQRANEISRARQVVNLLVPTNFMMEKPEVQLWFVSRFVQAVFKMGYRMPLEGMEARFLQELYMISNNMEGAIPVPPEWVDYVDTKLQNNIRGRKLFGLS